MHHAALREIRALLLSDGTSKSQSWCRRSLYGYVRTNAGLLMDQDGAVMEHLRMGLIQSECGSSNLPSVVA